MPLVPGTICKPARRLYDDSWPGFLQITAWLKTCRYIFIRASGSEITRGSGLCAPVFFCDTLKDIYEYQPLNVMAILCRLPVVLTPALNASVIALLFIP